MKTKCAYCGNLKSNSQFPITASPFWIDGVANICYDCTPAIVDANNLNQVDRWLQWLNLAFFPNEWRKIQQREENPFRAYVGAYQGLNYHKYDWGEQNEKLMNLARNGMVETELEELTPIFIEKLRKEWGSATPEVDLLLMEQRFNASLNDYNIAVDNQRDMLRKIARLSVMIDRDLEKGVMNKDMMTMYEKLLTSVTKTLETLEGEGVSTVSELVEFIEANGYRPNFYDGVARDELDMLEQNMKDYTRDLIEGELNLGDLYQAKKEQLLAARKAKQKENNKPTDEENGGDDDDE